MVEYNSKIETLKHIKTVANYLKKYEDALEENIKNEKSIKSSIDSITLIDMLHLLYKGEDIPGYNKLFNDIKSNSKNYKLGVFYTDENELLTSYKNEFEDRRKTHDKSKLEEPEKHEFDIWTPRLHEASVGTPMYDYFLHELRKALAHHYRCNRHHPEHFGNGINGMTIMDLSEMLCDWIASAERHEDGDIYMSIEILSKRFKYGTPMKKVLSNTCEQYLKIK